MALSIFRTLRSLNISAAKSPGKEIEILRQSPLLDPVWYRQTSSDLHDTPIDVARHYLQYGAAEGRNPSPNFDTTFYLENNPDVIASGMNPLIHYILLGAKEGRDPRRPSAAVARPMDSGEPSLPSPSTSFRLGDVPPRQDSKNTADVPFRSSNGESATARKPGNASHQAMPVFEWRKRVEQSGLFDSDWYLKKYRDVGRAGIDPLAHFIRFGSAELRNPGPKFDARWYVEEYPDAVSTGLEPLAHYLTIGREQGHEASGTGYKRWCKRFDTLSDEDRSIIRNDISSNAFPSLQLIVYFQRGRQDFVIRTIEALSSQLFGKWRARFVFERGYDPGKIEAARKAVEGDSRYLIISETCASDKLPQRFENSCFVFIAGGVLVREHALYMVASTATPADVQLVYSDEDTLDESGDRKDPAFKPQYSPELARSTNYFGPFVLVRGLEYAPEHIGRALLDGTVTIDRLVADVLLRSDARAVRHIASVLYHDALAPRPRTVASTELISDNELLPNFTIIIPSRDRLELLEPCIASIEERSEYPRDKIEIIVVDNGSKDEATLNYFVLLSGGGKRGLSAIGASLIIQGSIMLPLQLHRTKSSCS